MNRGEDRVIEIAERSAVLRSFARYGAALSQAMRQSRLLALTRPVADTVAARPGLTIMTAAVTHLILMAAVSRPPSWHWLILPLMFAAMGAVLWLMLDGRRSA